MINCYVVVTRGKDFPKDKLAQVPSARLALSLVSAMDMAHPTIFGTYLDKKLAKQIAKNIGGRVCSLVEELE